MEIELTSIGNFGRQRVEFVGVSTEREGTDVFPLSVWFFCFASLKNGEKISWWYEFLGLYIEPRNLETNRTAYKLGRSNPPEPTWTGSWFFCGNLAIREFLNEHTTDICEHTFLNWDWTKGFNIVWRLISDHDGKVKKKNKNL